MEVSMAIGFFRRSLKSTPWLLFSALFRAGTVRAIKDRQRKRATVLEMILLRMSSLLKPGSPCGMIGRKKEKKIRKTDFLLHSHPRRNYNLGINRAEVKRF